MRCMCLDFLGIFVWGMIMIFRMIRIMVTWLSISVCRHRYAIVARSPSWDSSWKTNPVHIYSSLLKSLPGIGASVKIWWLSMCRGISLFEIKQLFKEISHPRPFSSIPLVSATNILNSEEQEWKTCKVPLWSTTVEKNTQLGIVISKRLVTPDQIEPRWEARYVYFLYR